MNRIALAAAAASISLLATAPAMAQETPVEIYFGDLDTSSEAGLKALGQRVAAGVQQACSRPETRGLKVNLAWQQCRQDVLENAAEQLAARGMQLASIG